MAFNLKKGGQIKVGTAQVEKAKVEKAEVEKKSRHGDSLWFHLCRPSATATRSNPKEARKTSRASQGNLARA